MFERFMGLFGIEDVVVGHLVLLFSCEMGL